MSELEFLGALRVEIIRHRDLRSESHPHELFQSSTLEALLGGAFDGDVSLVEVLEHGDLGLGTLNGLDGELVVIDGEAWQARADATLARASGSALTPYVVVVPFDPAAPIILPGPLRHAGLSAAVGYQLDGARRTVAARIDGSFEHVRVRSVPKQRRPYPDLATALAQQRVTELADVTGTMVGFCFPNAMDGLEMTGWHLHFVTDDRTRGGHVLDFTLRRGEARLDDATELRVELPPAVVVHHHAETADEETLRRLEFDDATES